MRTLDPQYILRERGVEENIWTEKGRGNGGMEEIA